MYIYMIPNVQRNMYLYIHVFINIIHMPWLRPKHLKLLLHHKYSQVDNALLGDLPFLVQQVPWKTEWYTYISNWFDIDVALIWNLKFSKIKFKFIHFFQLHDRTLKSCDVHMQYKVNTWRSSDCFIKCVLVCKQLG